MMAGAQFGIVSHKVAAATVEMNHRAVIAATKFAANFCEAGLRLRYVPYDHDAYGAGPGEFLAARISSQPFRRNAEYLGHRLLYFGYRREWNASLEISAYAVLVVGLLSFHLTRAFGDRHLRREDLQRRNVC
jgi:hypothetical protein